MDEYVDDLLIWNIHNKYVKSEFSKSTAIMDTCNHLLDRKSNVSILHIVICLLPYLKSV